MSEIRILTEPELRQAVGLGLEEVGAIESVYPLISSGAASMPPIMRLDVPEANGEIDIKTAYLPGYSGIAVKVSAGFFDNPSKGLPSLGGLMMLFDAETGLPRAALFDNGYLTDLRTALAGAVAAKHLAPRGASRVGVIGAGVQAHLQLQAIRLVLDVAEFRVWARRREQAEALAAEVQGRIEICDSVTDVVATSDVVITTTPATEPLVTADMLHPGLHITAVGSDAEHKKELAGAVVSSADRLVCDSITQSRRLGELRGAPDVEAIELGAVIDGSAPGRHSENDITVCDLTGTGAQDTAIASLAAERATSRGLGTVFATGAT